MKLFKNSKFEYKLCTTTCSLQGRTFSEMTKRNIKIMNKFLKVFLATKKCILNKRTTYSKN